jgi:hypothetical protein
VKRTTITLKAFFICLLTGITFGAYSQTEELDNCNVVWTSQSKNSGESMPCGGGDIGLNVWVEKGDVLFYIQRSGTFDENNAFLKLGRVRITLSPNPFEGSEFKQELILKDGYVKISGNKGSLKADVNVWVDVFSPVVHVDISSNKAINAEAIYESWRYQDRQSVGKANNANSYKWAAPGDTKTYKDNIDYSGNGIVFYHRNKAEPSVFDVTVKQQGLDSVKEQLFNPLKDLTFGGMMEGTNMKHSNIYSGNYLDTDFKGWKLQSVSASRSHKINIYLHTAQAASIDNWQNGLQQTIKQSKAHEKTALNNTRNWWHQFWDRSFVFISSNNKSSDQWQAGRNYQLFRYMLGCNAFSNYPTKFNGGLFTYDPSLTDSTLKYTPDFRNWGGGTHTAQNQRLVYFPMIKNGDFDLLKPQFQFYLQILKNAELRSKVYWKHNGACFTEQLENFGLPNPAEYGMKRPEGYDKGMEYNAWLEYEWDTVLEFCSMMLETERYNGDDIKEYIPFIESCLTFFNEHYQYLAKQRGSKTFDGDGHIIFYPGSGAETYKMAYNSTSTITGLRTILTRLLELPSTYLTAEKRKAWTTMLERIPPISFAEFNGHKTIAPAKLWERIANINLETTQLYPVFPWGVYGVGKADLETAINTWRYDTNTIKKRNYIGWRQDNIFAARLALTEEAAKLNILKMKDSGRRFPAFWGPGYDWTPDHNWGGAGMIGLQEMLLQTDGQKIYLFPAWPKDCDVHFKLHAPYQTTVEGVVKNGKVETLKVVPQVREKDIINMF